MAVVMAAVICAFPDPRFFLENLVPPERSLWGARGGRNILVMLVAIFCSPGRGFLLSCMATPQRSVEVTRRVLCVCGAIEGASPALCVLECLEVTPALSPGWGTVRNARLLSDE